MIIKDITNIKPTVGDILELECEDTVVESVISYVDDDKIIVEISDSATDFLSEEIFDRLKKLIPTNLDIDNQIGRNTIRSLGFILGVITSHSSYEEGVKAIEEFIGSENMNLFFKAMKKLQNTPEDIRKQHLLSGIQEGMTAAQNQESTDNLNYLRTLTKINFDKLKAGMGYLTEAEYQGRKVSLGKPFLTPDGPKKRSVYVKNAKGNVVKVNFGDPKMKIKKSNPKRRKSFRARHRCDNPGPRWKARYWSCKFW